MNSPLHFALSVFVSYARKDRALCKNFLDEINKDSALGEVTKFWMDESLEPGDIWDEKIKQRLILSDVVLLLLTPNFINSNYCNKEFKIALDLHASGQATVIAILLEQCEYHQLPMERVHLLPSSDIPLHTASDKKLLANVALSIKYLIYERFEIKHKAIRAPEEWETGNLQCDLIKCHDYGKVVRAPGSSAILPATGPEIKRLRIYHDLVRAGRIPPGGWLIDSLAEEYWKQQEGYLNREEVKQEQFSNEIERQLPQSKIEYPSHEVEHSGAELNSVDVNGLTEEKERILQNGRQTIKELEDRRKQERARKARRIKRILQIRLTPRNKSQIQPTQIDPRLRLLAIFHMADETWWQELYQVMEDEGFCDLCQVSIFRFDPDNDASFAELAEHLHISQVILPLLSNNFCQSKLNQELCSASNMAYLRDMEKVKAPVLLENCDYGLNELSNWQFLPRHDLPVSEWPIKKQAYRNIVRTLIQNLLPNLPVGRYYSQWKQDEPLPLQKYEHNFREDGFLTWAFLQGVVGAFNSLIIWRMGYNWQHLAVTSLALSVLPLLLSFYLLWKQDLAEDPYIDWKSVFDDFNFSSEPSSVIFETFLTFMRTLLRLLPAAVAPLVFASLISVKVAFIQEPQTETPLDFLDIGIVGGLLFGAISYCITRRRLPKVLQQRQPPAPMEPLYEIKNGVLLCKTPYTDATRFAEGHLGKVENKHPEAARKNHQTVEISLGKFVRLILEGLCFGYIGWMIFSSISNRLHDVPFHFAVAGAMMILGESLVLSLYNSLNIARIHRRLDSLRHTKLSAFPADVGYRIKFWWPGLFKMLTLIFWCAFVMLVVDLVFSSHKGIAPPILTIFVFATILALFKRSIELMRFGHSSIELQV
jgi:hypothetical protein